MLYDDDATRKLLPWNLGHAGLQRRRVPSIHLGDVYIACTASQLVGRMRGDTDAALPPPPLLLLLLKHEAMRVAHDSRHHHHHHRHRFHHREDARQRRVE